MGPVPRDEGVLRARAALLHEVKVREMLEAQPGRARIQRDLDGVDDGLDAAPKPVAAGVEEARHQIRLDRFIQAGETAIGIDHLQEVVGVGRGIDRGQVLHGETPHQLGIGADDIAQALRAAEDDDQRVFTLGERFKGAKDEVAIEPYRGMGATEELKRRMDRFFSLTETRNSLLLEHDQIVIETAAIRAGIESAQKQVDDLVGKDGAELIEASIEAYEAAL